MFYPFYNPGGISVLVFSFPTEHMFFSEEATFLSSCMVAVHIPLISICCIVDKMVLVQNDEY